MQPAKALLTVTAPAAASAVAPPMTPALGLGAARVRERSGLLGPAWAELAFFLLFAGFFFYQTLLGLGMIRAYLGGYFAIISLVMLPPLLLSYGSRLHRRRYQLHRVDAAFLGFLAYFCVVIACNAPSASAAITSHHLLGVLYLFNLFVIFKTLDFQGRRFRRTLLASVAAMSAIVFAYSVDGTFYLAALGAARDPDSVATYQGFSRSYLVPLAVALACTRRRWLRWALYGIGLPTLYINTARSEFGVPVHLAGDADEWRAARQRIRAQALDAMRPVADAAEHTQHDDLRVGQCALDIKIDGGGMAEREKVGQAQAGEVSR